MTDYQQSLQCIQAKLDDLLREDANEASHPPFRLSCAERSMRVFSMRFQALSLSGDLTGLSYLDEDLSAITGKLTNQPDLWLLRAAVALKLHRFHAAQVALLHDPVLLASAAARRLRSDLDLQHGRYAVARQTLESLAAEDPTWDTLARLAHVACLFDDFDSASHFFDEAADQLTAKEMPAFAWIGAAHGFMFFERGRYDQARLHYERANAAFPGYWLVEQRTAELHTAEGRFADALALYTRLYTESTRPEWAHALGDLCLLAGDARTAHEWRTRALALYLDSTNRGETHFYHLLADLCCELPGRTAEATSWARADHTLRANHATEGDLAWALYRDGQLQPALICLQRALAFGVVSARLFLQAALILAAAGEDEQSRRYMRAARALNPAPICARITQRLTQHRITTSE